MKWLIVASFAALLTSVACGQTGAAAAVNAAKQRAIQSKVATTLPTTQMSVLIIPDNVIFSGVSLTDDQQSALVARLKSAPFRVETQELTGVQARGDRLPSGELFQQFKYPIMTIKQYTPGTAPITDPCSIPGVSGRHLGALQKVIATRLSALGQDPARFIANAPQNCVGTELQYYLNAALGVAP
jgi:hypothetical protein